MRDAVLGDKAFVCAENQSGANQTDKGFEAQREKLNSGQRALFEVELSAKRRQTDSRFARVWQTEPARVGLLAARVRAGRVCGQEEGGGGV